MFQWNICIGIGLSVFNQIKLVINTFKLAFVKKLAVPKPDRKSLFLIEITDSLYIRVSVWRI